MNISQFTTTRRRFLQGAGGGLMVAAATTFARPGAAYAAEDAAYLLENGFFRLGGAYGKLTEVSCDPTGGGNYEPAAFRSVFVGETDFFDASFNSDVGFDSADGILNLTGIQLPSTAALKQDQLNSPVPLPIDSSLGQTFTTTMYRFTRVGGQFPTWSNPNSQITMTLYSGSPETGLVEIATRVVDAVQDNGWTYLDVPAQPAGVYYLEISDASGTPGWWSRLDGTSVDLGGVAYNNRQRQQNRTMTLDVAGFNVDGVASWSLALDGPGLAMNYEVQWKGAARKDPGMTLITSWVNDGYSVDYADGILFSRFYGDEGAYLPAQQMKRRDAWTDPVIGAQTITATGTGPYDLQLSGTSPKLNGKMAADSLTLALISGTADPEATVSRSVTFDLLAHTEELPAIFPVFVASDQARAAQVSTFYWERALSYRFDSHAMDWADWNGRILDWTATSGSRAQADSLLNTKLDDDGYVWSWGDSRAWPFPDPDLFDARHFSSNAMYILATWRYYSWTGDEEFLTTMMPRVRNAMNFYLDSLDGKKGIVTINSPDHDGTDGSLPSNYWDVTSFGYQDAFINAYFYGALEALAQLEDHVGGRGRAARLRGLRKLAKKRYNHVFWNKDAGRYVQTVDVDGVAHDYGSTYVNLEAASFGLPSEKQAEQIFDWLDNGHTELQDAVVLIESGGLAPQIDAGHTMAQSFTANAAFVSVAARFPTYGARGAAFTMTLYAGTPYSASAVKIAEKQFSDWSDGRVAHIEVPKQSPGVYYLEVSNVSGALAWWSSAKPAPGGAAYIDGVLDTNAACRFLVALGEYFEGPADIYSKWVFAPRSTTRRNSYWFFLTHLTTPWGDEVQDGGAILYTSGFDVMARARYRGADDAWARMTTMLDRWSEPDHISGGTPLFRGEGTVNSSGASSVGTDIPFPESGLAPASFLYAFVGVEAEPDALVITPNLPSALTDAGVQNLRWRGKQLEIRVTLDTVSVTGAGVAISESYAQGSSVRISGSQVSLGG